MGPPGSACSTVSSAGLQVLADSAYGSGEIRVELRRRQHRAAIKADPTTASRPRRVRPRRLHRRPPGPHRNLPRRAHRDHRPQGQLPRFGPRCRDCPLQARCTTARDGRVAPRRRQRRRTRRSPPRVARRRLRRGLPPMAAHGRTIHRLARRPRPPARPLPRHRTQPARPRPPGRRAQPPAPRQPRPRPQRPTLDVGVKRPRTESRPRHHGLHTHTGVNGSDLMNTRSSTRPPPRPTHQATTAAENRLVQQSPSHQAGRPGSCDGPVGPSRPSPSRASGGSARPRRAAQALLTPVLRSVAETAGAIELEGPTP